MELSDLCKKISEKPCTLFIGAGFSIDSGGLSGDKLLSELKYHFGDSEEINMLSYLEDIIGIDNDARKKVEDVIKKYLVTLTPNENQEYLFSIPWNAVLTTNYDHIPDQIEVTIDRNREIIPIVDKSRDSINMDRDDYLYCFKLFGDMNIAYPQEGHMILTEGDRRYETSRLIHFINLFKDLCMSGNIIYLGYSFKDNLVLDILKDIKRTMPDIPWNGYMIKRTQINDKKIKKSLSDFNIEWIQGDVESFVKELKKIFTSHPDSFINKDKTVVLNNTGLIISKKSQASARDQISYLHNELFEPLSENPRLFFEGRDNTFYPFLKGWDIRRTIYPIEINTKRLGRFALDSNFHVIDRQLRGSSTENIKICMLGKSGSGKTTVSKRIAYEWYQRGHPVIFIEPKGYRLDNKVVEGFIEEILFNYQKRMEIDNSEVKLLRFLIISDNQTQFLNQIIELYDYLTTKEYLIDLLVVDRTTNITKNMYDEIQFNGVYKIDDTLESSDLKTFLEHFSKIDLDIPEEVFIRNLEDKRINESFFALMYSTIKESQKPLKETIIDEYESLNKSEQYLYSFVSLLESLGLFIHKKLISKYCYVTLNWLENEIENGKLNGILNINYEDRIITRHKIISEIIDKHEFITSNKYFEVLNNIVTNFTKGNFSEESFVHNLLISKITLDRPDIRITPNKLIELYNRTLDKIETRPLFHHLARNYIRENEFSKARAAIYKAKNTNHPRFFESQNNLLDTQGRIEIAEAEKQIENMAEKDTIWGHLDKAETFFEAAQRDVRVSPYPYQGMAKTYYLMGLISEDRLLRHNFCLLSLSKINYLKKNMGFNYRHTRKVEHDVFSLFSDDFDEIDAENIITNYKNADGYALLAEQKINREDYYNAERLVNKGLSYKPSLWLLRLKIDIINVLYQEDLDKFEKCISEYIKLNEYDLILSFELGKYYFKLEDYMRSYKTFDELRHKSVGYYEGYSFNQNNILFDRKEMKYFRGEITEMPIINKPGMIKCTQLLDYSYSIKVRISDIKYENPNVQDRVYFNIYFTFDGPQAFNVTLR